MTVTDAPAPQLFDALAAGRYPSAPQPLRQAATALSHAQAALDDHDAAQGQRAEQSVPGLVAAALETLGAGQPVPAGFAGQVSAALTAQEHAAAVRDAFTALAGRWETRWADLLEDQVDPLLTGALHTELLECLAELPAARQDAGDRDLADEAAFAGAPKPAKAARAAAVRLAGRYAALRSVQLEVVSHWLRGTWRQTEAMTAAGALEFPGFDDLWPSWGDLVVDQDLTAPPAPWPADPVARLLYAADHGAWVPSIDELEDNYARAKVTREERRRQATADRVAVDEANRLANLAAAGIDVGSPAYRRFAPGAAAVTR